MNNLITKYRSWAMGVPEHIGELIAIVMYFTFMISAAGATLSFTAGAYVPMAIFSAGVVLVASFVYLL